MTTALLLIDIQNDYFPGGAMELEGAVDAAAQARRLLDRFRTMGLPIVHIQHVSMRPGASFFLPDTQGVELNAVVTPLAGEPVFEKHFPNSFRETPLLEHLRTRGVERLVLCGMMTHMCMDATTRAAFDFGFSCIVAEDACATRSLAWKGEMLPARQVHGAFLAALGTVYAKVQGVEEIIAQMLA